MGLLQRKVSAQTVHLQADQHNAHHLQGQKQHQGRQINATHQRHHTPKRAQHRLNQPGHEIVQGRLWADPQSAWSRNRSRAIVG